jgi:peptidoglycan/xylan/chitin deacetylase (PgdA/CDA1 family)
MLVQAGIGIGLIGAAIHGAFHRNSILFGPVLSRLPTTRREIALTFDDGPNADATPRVLDVLGDLGVKATFFVLGRHAEQWPELVHRVEAEGHQIGNHGYFHRKLHLKSPFYVKRDLQLGKRAIERAGATSPQFFRAPHGYRNPWVSAIAASLGERTIGWTLGVWDTDRPGESEIVRRTIEGVNPGSIVLLHDGDGYNPNGDRTQTAKALPRIIGRLRERDYAFATLPVV